MNIVLKLVGLWTAEAQRALRLRREGRRNAPPPFSAKPQRPLRLCVEKHRVLILYLSIGATFLAQMFSRRGRGGAPFATDHLQQPRRADPLRELRRLPPRGRGGAVRPDRIPRSQKTREADRDC